MERKRHAKKGLTSLIAAVIFLIVAVTLSFTALFAWFSDKDYADIQNTPLTVVGESVTIGDRIVLTRSAEDASEEFVYARESGQYGRFDLTENGETVLDEDGNVIRLAIPAMSLGETVSLRLPFTLDQAGKYKIYFGNVSGDAFECGGVSHNMLELFECRAYLNTDKIENSDEGGFVTLSEALQEGEIAVLSGEIAEGESRTVEAVIELRMTVAGLDGLDWSAVAAKGFAIGSLGVCRL